MSESIESILDASLNTDESEVKESSLEIEAPSLLIEPASNKRRLNEDDVNLDDVEDDEEAMRSSRNKKMCIENDTEIEKDTTADEIVELSTLNDSTKIALADEDEPSELDKTNEPVEISSQEEILEEKSFEIETIEDDEEQLEQQQTFQNDSDDEIDEEQEEEEELDEEECEDSDLDDEVMMWRALQKSSEMPSRIPQNFQTSNDEPIELDDTDDDEENYMSSQQKSASTNSAYQQVKTEVEEDDFPLENDVLKESDNESEEDSPAMLNLRKKYRNGYLKNSHILSYEKIVKKARTFSRQCKPIISEFRKRINDKKSSTPLETTENEKNEKKLSESIDDEKSEEGKKEDEEVEKKKKVADSGVGIESEPMEVDVRNSPKQEQEIVTNKKSESSSNHSDEREENSESTTNNFNNNHHENNEEVSCDDVEASKEHNNNKISDDTTANLLDEIDKTSIDEIFSRYVVLKSSERSASLDEFSEELFNCLQLNKIEIEKATQVWNTKLNNKFKIRQLMEKVRRHRAVMEIETFGYKPETSGNHVHPMISSKSSTTTNSESENYDKGMRMSNESVNRLIQDVRASIMKRDERQRVEDSAALSENVFDSSWNNQNNSIQGRQGQTVDVQSIINDFRQKNPQEIPRRGRRVKSINSSSFFDGQMSNNLDDSQILRNEFSSISQDFSSGSLKSIRTNQFPEVSLHPVHQNLYKNHLNQSGELNFGGQQKSSLLQSILTKSTKSPIGFHTPVASTSTLARLLTAPERSLQSTPKQQQNFSPSSGGRQSTSKVHNGEITITPINCSRNKDFAMDDDDENSMEPPLVIDENFDGRSFEEKKSAELLCQGCKKNKAFFMCAGCSRQWYCSKECQEMAWDSHSAYCSV